MFVEHRDGNSDQKRLDKYIKEITKISKNMLSCLCFNLLNFTILGHDSFSVLVFFYIIIIILHSARIQYYIKSRYVRPSNLEYEGRVTISIIQQFTSYDVDRSQVFIVI